MKRLQAKSVYQATASHENGGNHLIGYFVRESDATRAAVGKGEWGSDGSVRQIDLDVRVYENFEEYISGNKEDLKTAALAKLSHEEREALGLV